MVDGTVEGPIQGGEVILKSQTHVIGDIQHRSLSVESAAYFDGRSIQTRATNGREPEKLGRKTIREIADKEREAVPAAE